jgi:CRISPR-associated protein Csm4
MDGQSNLLELHRLNHFGSAFEQTRVNLRDGDQPLPYRVGGFRFDKDCGLYLIVSGSEAALTLFERGMTSLSAGGIGGKGEGEQIVGKLGTVCRVQSCED